ncbi:MAG: glycoside hydrolase family 8 [Solirubrobacterales bacterium]|nr:glycoside hydrolase family 8 [Solirubrobacterales bacterium]
MSPHPSAVRRGELTRQRTVTKRRRIALVAACLTGGAVVVGIVALLRGGGSGPGQGAGDPRWADAPAVANAFLHRYVEPDGRVVRIDQGGDTVSEGQAYAMLLAVVDHDRGTFARVWSWTRENLRQPNGLLAWHWEDGKVVSTGSAADADLDAAWALLLASERLGAPSYKGEALKLASDILEHETVSLDGRSLLVAGDWATSFPAVVDPSYFAPGAFAALGRASGDSRWEQLEETSREVLGELTERPTGLAPDWAVVEADGEAKATPPPGEGGEAVFGYDAVRVPLWQAQSCAGPDARFAAGMESFFDETATAGPAATYSLEGEPRGGSPGAPMLVAAAMASDGAGNGRGAVNWMRGAEDDVRAAPTYYGMALLALGRAALEREGGLAC